MGSFCAKQPGFVSVRVLVGARANDHHFLLRAAQLLRKRLGEREGGIGVLAGQ